jgi:hypothetical protein
MCAEGWAGGSVVVAVGPFVGVLEMRLSLCPTPSPELLTQPLQEAYRSFGQLVSLGSRSGKSMESNGITPHHAGGIRSSLDPAKPACMRRFRPPGLPDVGPVHGKGPAA